MHSCCPCIVLLFVVQFKFEFELNVFESFQKWKSFSFTPFHFSAQSAHLSFLPLPFSSFLAAQKSHRRPSRLPLPGLARHLTFLFHSPTDRRGPPVRPSFFLLPCAPRTPQSPAAARVLRCALARTPRASAPACIRRPHPLEPYRAQVAASASQTLARCYCWLWSSQPPSCCRFAVPSPSSVFPGFVSR